MRALGIAGCAWILGLAALAGPARAAEPGMLICATTHSVECDGTDEECLEGNAEAINFPDFFRVDFDERELQVLDHDRRGEVTPFEQLGRSDSRGWITLQGVENGRPWSMLIVETTGRFSLTVSEDDAAFNVFGGCTVP